MSDDEIKDKEQPEMRYPVPLTFHGVDLEIMDHNGERLGDGQAVGRSVGVC